MLPIVYVVGALLVVFLIGQLPFLRIKEVSLVGSDNAAIIERIATLKGQSIFSKNVSRLPEQLLREHVELANLTCQRGLPDTVRCQAVTRQPKLIWISQGKPFLTDSNGIVYAPAGSESLLLVEDRSSAVTTVGTVVAGSDIIASYEKLAGLLKDQKLKLDRFFITETYYQVNAVLVGSDDPAMAIPPSSLTANFATTSPLEDQVKTLTTLLKTHPGAVKTSVDLRVPGYVYYK